MPADASPDLVAATIAGLVVLGFGFWKHTVHLIGRHL